MNTSTRYTRTTCSSTEISFIPYRVTSVQLTIIRRDIGLISHGSIDIYIYVLLYYFDIDCFTTCLCGIRWCEIIASVLIPSVIFLWFQQQWRRQSPGEQPPGPRPNRRSRRIVLQLRPGTEHREAVVAGLKHADLTRQLWDAGTSTAVSDCRRYLFLSCLLRFARNRSLEKISLSFFPLAFLQEIALNIVLFQISKQDQDKIFN